MPKDNHIEGQYVRPKEAFVSPEQVSERGFVEEVQAHKDFARQNNMTYLETAKLGKFKKKFLGVIPTKTYGDVGEVSFYQKPGSSELVFSTSINPGVWQKISAKEKIKGKEAIRKMVDAQLLSKRKEHIKRGKNAPLAFEPILEGKKVSAGDQYVLQGFKEDEQLWKDVLQNLDMLNKSRKEKARTGGLMAAAATGILAYTANLVLPVYDWIVDAMDGAPEWVKYVLMGGTALVGGGIAYAKARKQLKPKDILNGKVSKNDIIVYKNPQNQVEDIEATTPYKGMLKYASLAGLTLGAARLGIYALDAVHDAVEARLDDLKEQDGYLNDTLAFFDKVNDMAGDLLNYSNALSIAVQDIDNINWTQIQNIADAMKTEGLAVLDLYGGGTGGDEPDGIVDHYWVDDNHDGIIQDSELRGAEGIFHVEYAGDDPYVVVDDPSKYNAAAGLLIIYQGNGGDTSYFTNSAKILVEVAKHADYCLNQSQALEDAINDTDLSEQGRYAAVKEISDDLVAMEDDLGALQYQTENVPDRDNLYNDVREQYENVQEDLPDVAQQEAKLGVGAQLSKGFGYGLGALALLIPGGRYLARLAGITTGKETNFKAPMLTAAYKNRVGA